MRREAAHATEEEGVEDDRKGAIDGVIGDAKVRREEAIDENAAEDDLRSALAAAPREGIPLPPCIAERAATIARGGLCGAEAAGGAEARGAEAVDEILIDEKKEAAIDGQRTCDDKGGESSSCRELLQPRRELLLAESAATDETRRVSLLDRRERIRSASLVRKRDRFFQS